MRVQRRFRGQERTAGAALDLGWYSHQGAVLLRRGGSFVLIRWLPWRG